MNEDRLTIDEYCSRIEYAVHRLASDTQSAVADSCNVPRNEIDERLQKAYREISEARKALDRQVSLNRGEMPVG